MTDKEQIKELIKSAFAAVEYPGDWCLRGSNEGDEPFRVERDFKGKTDWQKIDPTFLDQAPDGLGSALSFFSDEAFHFFLPAYMIADLEGWLKRSNPVFHLTHGLDDSSRNERINPRRYGARTWSDYAKCKFAMFTREEVTAIVAYLKFKTETAAVEREEVDEALGNYWLGRLAGPQAGDTAASSPTAV